MGEKTHLDLFSGIGGFAWAAGSAGYRTVAFVEREAYCQKILAQEWPGVPCYPDVRKFYRMAEDMSKCPDCCDEPFCELCGTHFFECDCLGCAGWDDEYGEIDLITAGVPCQPASLIGQRGGGADERWLWGDAIRIIGRLRPSFALLENPTGVLSVDGGRGFSRILADIHAIGFDVWWENIPACAVGAPHRRERIWLILADTQRTGLERYPRNEYGAPGRQRPPHRPVAAGGLSPGQGEERWGLPGARIRRVAHGIPDRIHRIAALGNSIVPAVAFELIKIIEKAERQTP